ncbi:MAG: hypothetical protein V3T74_14015 [Gemmatimonadales bacterium]
MILRRCKLDGEVYRNSVTSYPALFLQSVMNWACTWQDHEARYLMKENLRLSRAV